MSRFRRDLTREETMQKSGKITGARKSCIKKATRREKKFCVQTVCTPTPTNVNSHCLTLTTITCTHTHTAAHVYILFRTRFKLRKSKNKLSRSCNIRFSHSSFTHRFERLCGNGECAHTSTDTHRYEFMMDFQRAADVVVIIIIFIFIHIAAVAASIVIAVVVVVVRPISYSTTTYMYS